MLGIKHKHKCYTTHMCFSKKKNRNAIQHTCVLTQFLSLSTSLFSTVVDVTERVAVPVRVPRSGSSTWRSPLPTGCSSRRDVTEWVVAAEVTADWELFLSFHIKKCFLWSVDLWSCDLWLSGGRRRLEVEGGWMLLDLNSMVQKIHMLKLYITHNCIAARLKTS